MKRRRPDLLFVLAVFLGLGVLVTGITQAMTQPEGAITLPRQQ